MQPSISRRVPERAREGSRGRACERSGSLNVLTYLQSACLVFHPAPSVQRGERLTLSLLSALRRTLLSVCLWRLPSFALSRALSLALPHTHWRLCSLPCTPPLLARPPTPCVPLVDWLSPIALLSLLPCCRIRCHARSWPRVLVRTFAVAVALPSAPTSIHALHTRARNSLCACTCACAYSRAADSASRGCCYNLSPPSVRLLDYTGVRDERARRRRRQLHSSCQRGRCTRHACPWCLNATSRLSLLSLLHTRVNIRYACSLVVVVVGVSLSSLVQQSTTIAT